MFTFQVGAATKGNSKWTKFLIFRANWWQLETHPKLKWKNKIDDNKGARFNSLSLIQPWNLANRHEAPGPAQELTGLQGDPKKFKASQVVRGPKFLG